jgi:glycerol-3-phosphate cytidylyltransferase
MIIITFGSFDLFHIGHLNILKYCKKILNNSKDKNNKLIVGVSSDNLNKNKKGKLPIINIENRLEIIKNINGVDEVFIEETLEKKLEYCKKYNADILIMGDDHLGEYDFLKKYGLKVIYKPRTKNISTTDIKNKIINNYLSK